LARLEQELNDLRSKKAGLEDAMKKKERIAALLDRRDNLLTQITGLEQRRAAKSIELQNSMADAWAVLLSQPIRSSIEALRTKEAELQTAILRQELLKELGKKPGAECPACLQEISPAVRKRIEASLEKSGKSSSSSQERELGLVRRRLTALLSRREEGKGGVLELQWRNVDEIEIDIASKKSEVEDIRRQLQDIDEEGLRKTKAEFEMVVRQMDPVERGIADTRSKLLENVGLAENIQKKLDKLAGANLAGERRRREAFTKLHSLMDAAVAAYRDELRKRVQADATRHLKALTTEPEYSALRINDSYGLTIVHKDGTDIPIRSAGAEHIVALCLMGALQNNAPLRGPIVIDSPFGRLDRGHTRNVVRALPNMAKQVVLLVYEDELPPDLAREELLTSLRGEWKLERRTARHTELVPRKD
jgi:DNA sulfur modification protein DndD